MEVEENAVISRHGGKILPHRASSLGFVPLALLAITKYFKSSQAASSFMKYFDVSKAMERPIQAAL